MYCIYLKGGRTLDKYVRHPFFHLNLQERIRKENKKLKLDKEQKEWWEKVDKMIEKSKSHTS